MDFTLPRPLFNALVETLGDPAKAEKFAASLEATVRENECRSAALVEKTKGELKLEMRDEIITREVFEQAMKLLDERFASLNFKFNLLIFLVVLALTLVNPTFVDLIRGLLPK